MNRTVYGEACCLDCHFQYEELEIFHRLPPDVARALQREHDELRAAGYPRDQVEDHAAREDAIFARYPMPADIRARVLRDHRAFEEGRMPLT